MPDLPKNVKLELLPPKEAVQYFQRRKRLTKTFSWQDLYQEEHTRQFTVAKLLRVDLLQTVYDAMQQAFTEGKSPKDFEKQLTPVLQKAGWWGKKDIADPVTGEIVNAQLGSPERLRLIYDVNLRTGYAAGRWARIERGRRVNPYIIYRTARDDRVRASHRPWDNLALPVDDPFWNTHYPPNGWRCRCIAYGIDQAGLDRLQGAGFKIKTTAPKIEYREFTNRVTDKTVRVPVGIDPGWAYNPGKAAAQTTNAAAVQKLDSAAQPLAAAAVRDLVQSDAFQRFFTEPKGLFPIAVVAEQSAARIGSSTHTVNLSEETMLKQHENHPELTASEYKYVQEAIDRGREIPDGARATIFLLEEDEGYVTVVKSTQSGKAIFLTSFRRLSSDEVKRDEEVRRLLRKANKEG